MIIVINVVQPMPFLPPMTGNGKHSTYKNGDDWGMVYDCFILFQSLYNTIYEFHLSKPLKTHLGPKIRRMFKPIRMVPSGKLT